MNGGKYKNRKCIPKFCYQEKKDCNIKVQHENGNLIWIAGELCMKLLWYLTRETLNQVQGNKPHNTINRKGR